MTLLQLASLTACAKSLAEPEDEVLDLEGLAEATDEEEKAKVVNSDSRVDMLRGHLLEAVKAITTAYRGDAEIAQALAEFLKACTSTNISTPLSLDALSLADLLSHLIYNEFESTWLSISSLLLFRLRKNPLSNSGQVVLQAVIGRILEKGLNALPSIQGMCWSPAYVSNCYSSDEGFPHSHGITSRPGAKFHGLGFVISDILRGGSCVSSPTS